VFCFLLCHEYDVLFVTSKERVIVMKTNFKNWLKAAGIRAIKTVAQTAVATIGTSAIISEVNWLVVGSASLLAGILSLLTSVAGLPELDVDNKYLFDMDE
jgi:hypothetical protein